MNIAITFSNSGRSQLSYLRLAHRANSLHISTIFPMTRGDKLQRINSRSTYVMRAFYGRNNFQSTFSHRGCSRTKLRWPPAVESVLDIPERESQRISPRIIISRVLIISDHKESATRIRRRSRRFLALHAVNGSRVRGTAGILMSGQVKNYPSALISR